jgi:hypothetical protein
VQHAGGRIAERIDALGVQVVAEHAAELLPNLVEGKRCPLMPIVSPAGRMTVGRFAAYTKRPWCWARSERLCAPPSRRSVANPGLPTSAAGHKLRPTTGKRPHRPRPHKQGEASWTSTARSPS